MPRIPKKHDPKDKYLRPYRARCRVEEEILNGKESDTISSWRIFKIIAEFVQGFELLRKYDLAASIFGSARAPEDSPYYHEARVLGKMLAESGFAVITGGGGGIMEAANRGAREGGGASVGLNIRLPEEQSLNRYVTDAETFHYFFTRKVSLAFASEVYIYFPGGFGTLDEMFEILTLVQTKKIKNLPIILVGRGYWTPLLQFFHNTLLERYHTVDAEDIDILRVVDSAEEAHRLVLSLVDLSACRGEARTRPDSRP